ncbi:MAG: hypothetical protein G3M70_07390 [Candidatus Nitronauta litoralis]|uniref:Uncharacterized protein n=1 Tax=Candidatus Nitronauta litoralis TaxID=2705533 RepID=A0A7T0BVI2_9BACT|nr:MAG: hypothetical protein G3M70_07390 [Candidatus Nitronauta litoralis]
MELLVNDLSIQGQFQEVTEFKQAIKRVMKMRDVARRYGHPIYCHRNIPYVDVTKTQNMKQVIQFFSHEEKRALTQWLTKNGPFWEDDRNHSPDDYFEYKEEIVTDTALGEAAYSSFQGIEKRLVSLKPSSWEISPLNVSWNHDSGAVFKIDIFNHWEIEELENILKSLQPPIESWTELGEVAKDRFQNLTFSESCFEYLKGEPYAPGASRQIQVLLNTLNCFVECFDSNGKRTPEGQQIYQDHFTGQKAWFTDSSDSEKNEFKSKLTFSHPEINGQNLFCPMHGKEKSRQLRIHYSWTGRAYDPLFVVYVGPKLTKR